MLIKSSQWIEQNFAEGSRPSHNTVLKWIREREIDGQIIGGLAYIEHDTLNKRYIDSLPRAGSSPKLIAGKYQLK